MVTEMSVVKPKPIRTLPPLVPTKSIFKMVEVQADHSQAILPLIAGLEVQADHPRVFIVKVFNSNPPSPTEGAF